MTGALYWINTFAGLVLFVSVAWFLGTALAAALHARRFGMSGTAIFAQVTTSVIGFGLIMCAAVLGGKAALMLFQQVHMPVSVTLMVLGQLAFGVLTSWLVAQAFHHWLSGPIQAWFAGGEAGLNG
ncbi:MAG TPA: hypothetical protein VGK74_18045 [Symbiobacteriaceae bacterium]|jgi:Mg2+/Co2+ transporter CorB